LLRIHPTITPEYAIEQLRDMQARLDRAANANTVQDAFHEYLNWVTLCAQTFGPILLGDELDRLILTRRYWALLNVVSTNVAGVLWDVIRVEIAERRAAFDDAISELDSMRSPLTARAAVVPDTNVWMRHHNQLADLPWGEYLNLRGSVRLTIWLPSVVLEELDKLKRDRGEMVVGGERYPRRDLARRALRSITEWFGSNPSWAHHFNTNESNSRQVEVRVITEDRDHVRLASVDAEIIDIAQSFTPFFVNSQVMTYDVSLAFRARAVGNSAILLPEPESSDTKTSTTT